MRLLKNTIKDAEKFIKGSDERKDDKSSKAKEKIIFNYYFMSNSY